MSDSNISTQNLGDYFTPEIQVQIDSMNKKQMEAILQEFTNSAAWIAMLKYRQVRFPTLDSILRTTNPHTDPHKVSWAQGCMAGLCDLESFIIDLITPKLKNKQNNLPNNSTQGSVIMGN